METISIFLWSACLFHLSTETGKMTTWWACQQWCAHCQDLCFCLNLVSETNNVQCFYVRSNARICLHFLSFLNICKKPTLISTRHKSFLTCSLDRTKHLVIYIFALAYSSRQFCTTVASHHTAVMQIMDTELWLDGLGWDDRKCCPSHDFWHRLQLQHQWVIHVLHPEQIWLLPQHTVYSVCSYLPDN